MKEGKENPLAVAARALLSAGTVTREQIHAAQTRAREDKGIFATYLIEAGASKDAVLAAHGQAYGLQVVPPSALAAVDPASVAGVDLALCQRLLAVPFGRVGDRLQVAFAQPAWVHARAVAALPAHDAFLAGEVEMKQALARLAAAGSAPAPATTPQPERGGTALMAAGLAAQAPASGVAPTSAAKPDPAPVATTAPATASTLPGTGAASVATTGAASVATPGAANLSPGPASRSTGAATGAVASGGSGATTDLGPVGPGTAIGEYQVIRPIGGGGMATVYLAQTPDGREIALKVMQPHLANDPSFVQRFLHEVRSTIDLHHGNVVETYAYGEDGGRYWMASEFVDAGTVEALMQKVPRMPAPLAVEIFAQLVSGLNFAHQKGIVHRDVKPANMLLTSSGVLKVADFGIAKTVGGAALTQTGMLVGTPAYMSPEQARGEVLDARSDLYAAAVVLYELLSGVNPNAAPDAASTVARLLKGVVPPIYEKEPAVPPQIEALLDALLCADPRERPASGHAVLESLGAYLGTCRARRPNLLADALSRPEAIVQELAAEESRAWLDEGQRLMAAGPAERRQASLALYRAVIRDPENAKATALLEQLCEVEGIRFGGSENPKVQELERLLEEDPENAGILQRLANLYRNEGNLYKAVGFFKRYLRIRPDDGYTAGQLSMLTGQQVEVRKRAPRGGRSPVGTGMLASSGGTPPAGAPGATQGTAMGADTAALVAGVHTGGFRAAKPVAPGAHPEPGEPSEPTPDPTALDFARAIWSAWGLKLVMLAVLIGGGVLLFRGIGAAIGNATDEAFRVADDAARNENAADSTQLQAQHVRGMARASDEAASDAKTLFEKGLGEYRRGLHQKALQTFEELRTRYPKRPQATEALFYQGKAHFDAGDPSAAARTFQAFREASPGSGHYVEALMAQAQAELAYGQLREATETASRLLRDHPTSPLVRQARMARAAAFEKLGRDEAAARDYREVIANTGPDVPYYDEARAGLARTRPGE